MDKAIHEFYSGVNEIKWLEFASVGLLDPAYQYYYAEDKLYVIKDVEFGCYYFIPADSPADALKQLYQIQDNVIYSRKSMK